MPSNNSPANAQTTLTEKRDTQTIFKQTLDYDGETLLVASCLFSPPSILIDSTRVGTIHEHPDITSTERDHPVEAVPHDAIRMQMDLAGVGTQFPEVEG